MEETAIIVTTQPIDTIDKIMRTTRTRLPDGQVCANTTNKKLNKIRGVRICSHRSHDFA